MLISAIDLIKRGLDLYKKNAALFITYALLISAPSIVISLLRDTLMAVFHWRAASFVTLLYGFVFFILSITAHLASLWFMIALIKVTATRYEGKEVTKIKEMIMSVKPLLLPAIVASILSGLAIFGGLLLLIIPGIIFSVWFAFTLYSVVLDGQKDTAALRFSKNLVAGRWWGVFWRILLPSIFFLIISWLLQTPFEYIGKYSDSTIMVYLSLLVSTIVTIALGPFLASTQTILYMELKKTKTTAPEMKPTPPQPPTMN